jgi:predicted nucleic acid-binding protein
LDKVRHSRLIIADAGPLIALSIAKLLPATTAAFGALLVPQAVVNECLSEIDAPGTADIEACITNGTVSILSDTNTVQLDEAYLQGLGSGEIAVLAYAKSHKLLALVDERRARKVAMQLDIPVIGTGAILLELKRQNYIASVQPTLDRWNIHGYFLSESLQKQIMHLAQE